MAKRGRPKKVSPPKVTHTETPTDQASLPDATSSVNDEDVIAQAKRMEQEALSDLPPIGGGPTPTPAQVPVDQFEEKAKRSAILALTLIGETRKKVGMEKPIPAMVESSFVESFVELCRKYQINADMGPEIVFGSCIAYFAWEGYEFYQERKKARVDKTGKPGKPENNGKPKASPVFPNDESGRDS